MFSTSQSSVKNLSKDVFAFGCKVQLVCELQALLKRTVLLRERMRKRHVPLDRTP